MNITNLELFWLAACVALTLGASPVTGLGTFDNRKPHYYLAVVLAAVLGATAFDEYLFRTLMREDGVAEWATFYLFLLAGFCFIKRAKRLHTNTTNLNVAGLVLLGLFCVFVAGEEISWGQRLFGFQPPEVFLEYNFQQESNFHNFLKDRSLFSISLDSKNLVALIACSYGILLPMACGLAPALTKHISEIAPDIRFMGFYALVAWTEWVYPVEFAGEAAECFLGAIFYLSQPIDVKRKDYASLLVALLLSLITAPILNVIYISYDQNRVDVAKKEVRLLGEDMFHEGVDLSRLFRKKSVHKRMYTAEKAGYFQLGENNRFLERKGSALVEGGRRDRLGYYLDPWNNPYWIKWLRKESKLVVYSFGANRRRDISFSPSMTLTGDDIYFMVDVRRN